MKKTLTALMIITFFSNTFYASDSLINKKFPSITGTSLSGNDVTFPDDISGRVAVLSIAFKQRAQLCINTWADELLPKYGIDQNVQYYEVPMSVSYTHLTLPTKRIV